MAVTIHINGYDGVKAEPKFGEGYTCFELQTADGVTISLFGYEHQRDAIKMIADIFNDAFGPKPTEEDVEREAMKALEDLPF